MKHFFNLKLLNVKRIVEFPFGILVLRIFSYFHSQTQAFVLKTEYLPARPLRKLCIINQWFIIRTYSLDVNLS